MTRIIDAAKETRLAGSVLVLAPSEDAIHDMQIAAEGQDQEHDQEAEHGYRKCSPSPCALYAVPLGRFGVTQQC